MLDRYVVGGFLLCFFRLKYMFIGRKKNSIHHPKKILVIRLWALWSSLLSFPMIKQLKAQYGNSTQYDLLASTRNIGVFKNQWYFHQLYNLFSLKWLCKLICSFKSYDIVIDVEEYFRISTFMALWLGKVTIGFGNLWNRSIGYTNPVIYNDQQHTILTFLDLLKPLGIKPYVPEAMEPLIFQNKDTIKVNKFLENIQPATWNVQLVCMHTWWAETSQDRFWAQENRVQLIKRTIWLYKDAVHIFLSWTAFETMGVQKILAHLDEQEKKHVTNLCGMFNLYEFAYLLQQCTLMISNDTGPMHLSAAMWTRTIGLFGPEIPRRFGPYPLSKNIWLYKWNGIPAINVHLEQRQKSSQSFVNLISVDDVFTLLKDALWK